MSKFSKAALWTGLAVFAMGAYVLPHAALADQTVTVQVSDSEGSGISGVLVERGNAGLGWAAVGFTNASGNIATLMPDGVKGLSVRVTYEGVKRTKSQNITVNPTFVFQTVKATVSLNDSTAAPVSGGAAEVRYGGTWRSMGVTNGSGLASRELFPGSYPFRVMYNGGSVQKSGVASESTPVAFTTTNVKIQYSGTLEYNRQGTSSAQPFVGGAMELLPGTYRFQAENYMFPRTLRVGSENIVRSAIIARLTNGNGGGVADGLADYKVGGVWYDIPGSTNVKGYVGGLVPGLLGSTPVRMSAPEDVGTITLTQTHATDSVYNFELSKVVVRVLDVNGKGIPDVEISVQGDEMAWLGLTNNQGKVTADVFAGNRTFRAQYEADNKSQKNVTVSAATTTVVTFQAENVMVSVIDHAGAPIEGALIEHDTTQYFGTTGADGLASKELLPASHKITANVNGSDESKTASSGWPLVFQTGQIDSAGDATQIKLNGVWTPFVDLMEVLPGTYQMRFTATGMTPQNVVVTLGLVTNVN